MLIEIGKSMDGSIALTSSSTLKLSSIILFTDSRLVYMRYLSSSAPVTGEA